MIVGLGLDIVEVSRVSERLATRILSKEEYELWQKRGDKDFLAGRFALKEAFFKALGTGIRNYKLKDISFVPDSLGKLHVEKNEVIEEIEKKYGFEDIHVTLSHDGGMSAAVVIFEKRDSR